MAGRRRFVCAMAGTLAAAGCGGGGAGNPLAPPALEPRTLRLPLMPVGATVALFDRDLELAVTRLSTAQVVAVSRTCTHQGCRVSLPEPGRSTLDCPCHGSRFTLEGALVNGPALRALPTFPARVEGAEVVISVG